MKRFQMTHELLNNKKKVFERKEYKRSAGLDN